MSKHRDQRRPDAGSTQDMRACRHDLAGCDRSDGTRTGSRNVPTSPAVSQPLGQPAELSSGRRTVVELSSSASDLGTSVAISRAYPGAGRARLSGSSPIKEARNQRSRRCGRVVLFDGSANARTIRNQPWISGLLQRNCNLASLPYIPASGQQQGLGSPLDGFRGPFSCMFDHQDVPVERARLQNSGTKTSRVCRPENGSRCSDWSQRHTERVQQTISRVNKAGNFFLRPSPVTS